MLLRECFTFRSSLIIVTAMVAISACSDDDIDIRRDGSVSRDGSVDSTSMDSRRDSSMDRFVATDTMSGRDGSMDSGTSTDMGNRPDSSSMETLQGDADMGRTDGSTMDAMPDLSTGGDVLISADSSLTDAAEAMDGQTGDSMVMQSDAGLDGTTSIDAPMNPEVGGNAVNRPLLRPATTERIAQLRVPSGFHVSVFARDLNNPRMLAVGPDGAVYVTTPMTNQVVRLIDRDGDGMATASGERSVVLTGEEAADLQGVHGIAIHENHMYLASIKAVYQANLSNGSLSGLKRLVGNLPDGGQHANRTLAIGPDQKLYVTVGSSCNACNESNSEQATMLRLELDGSPAANSENPAHPIRAFNPLHTVSSRVFASGLRNTLGFDWNPSTSELIGLDQGADGLGNDIPGDELNVISGGKSYGWPYCWGNRASDPIMSDPSQVSTKEAYCQTTEPQQAALPAHSSPIGLLFYRGTQFPQEYRGDAFITLRGSWNREQPTGYKVVRVRFQGGYAIEDFLTGFLIENGAAQFGRLAGLTMDNQGSLLIAEDSNGVIYRVSYGPEPVDGGVGDGGNGV